MWWMWLLACGGTEPVVASDVALKTPNDQSAPDQQRGPMRDGKAAKKGGKGGHKGKGAHKDGKKGAHAGKSRAACADIVRQFRKLAQTGCQVPDGLWPMSLRALHQAPFAAQGQIFAEPELTAFFTAANQGCDDKGWYKGVAQNVVLKHEKALACVQTIKQAEAKAAESMALHPGLGELMLTKGASGIQEELTRAIDSDANAVRFQKKVNNNGDLSYTWIIEEGEVSTESAIGVRCASGECSFWAAG